LGNFLTRRIAPEFEGYGLELTKLLVENISLPPAVEEVLDKRTSMGVVGNLAAYTQFNVANSIPDAAKNPGGLAAAHRPGALGAAGFGRKRPGTASHSRRGPLLRRRGRAADRAL
jgi:membrane protease subunit (stomatin/prohibitin family)